MLGRIAMPTAPHAELCSTRVLQSPRALRGSRQRIPPLPEGRCRRRRGGSLRGAADYQRLIFVELTLNKKNSLANTEVGEDFTEDVVG